MDVNERRTFLSTTFNFLGGVSGLISLSLIIWNGGTLWQTVKDHGRRLDGIELGGSIGLREHVKQDDERVSDLRQRTLHLEETSIKVLEAMGELKAINAKLDALKEKVDSKFKP